MSMHSSQAGALRQPSPGIGRLVRDWIEMARQRRRIRREMAELAKLPLHLLRDIGLEQYASPREPIPRPHWY